MGCDVFLQHLVKRRELPGCSIHRDVAAGDK
jgi:hypothetical protein